MSMVSILFVLFLYFPDLNIFTHKEVDPEDKINWKNKILESYLTIIGCLVFLGVNYCLTIRYMNSIHDLEEPVARKRTLKSAQIEKSALNSSIKSENKDNSKLGLTVKVDKLGTSNEVKQLRKKVSVSYDKWRENILYVLNK